MRKWLAPWWLWLFSLFFAGLFTLSLPLQSIALSPWIALPLFSLILFCGGNALLSLAVTKRTASSRSFLYYSTLLFICWLPYLFFLYPGNVSTDSLTQMKSLIGIVPLTNANPVFQTFLVGVAMTIGKVLGNMDYGVLSYVLIQSVLMALLLGYMLTSMQGTNSRFLFFSLFLYNVRTMKNIFHLFLCNNLIICSKT